MQAFLCIGLVVAACVVVGYVCLRLFRGRANRSRPPEQEAALELFAQAVELRSPMAVRFAESDPVKPLYFGPCLRFDSGTMSIDLGSAKFPAEMPDDRVLVRFALSDANNSSYHQFTSRISGVRRNNGCTELQLDIPEKVGCGQRRNFVRISPAREAVWTLGTWRFDDENLSPDEPAGTSRTLPPGERSMSACSLADISAGGLCIEIGRQGSGPLFDTRIGNRLLCLLHLNPVLSAAPPAIWLDCAVVNRRIQEGANVVALGIHFKAWSAAGLGNEAKTWTMTGEGGYIPSLADWVWQHQLAQRDMLNHGSAMYRPGDRTVQ